jgi:hypothetical protein
MDQSKHVTGENRNPTSKRTIKELEVEATAWDFPAGKVPSDVYDLLAARQAGHSDDEITEQLTRMLLVIRGGRDRQFAERIQYSSPTP